MADNHPAPPDDIDDPDDEVGLDEVYLGRSRRLSLGLKMFYVALFLSAGALVVYLVLTILYPDQFATRSWIGAKSEKERPTGNGSHLSAFALGGVRFGMTPADVGRIYPSIALVPVPGGGRTGTFRHHDGAYRVSFRGPPGGERAYRVRSEHTFAQASYLELLSDLTEKYGQSAAAGCGAGEAAVAIGCTLRWTLPGVRLEAAIRTAAPAAGGAAATVLAVTATDTRPAGAVAGPEGR